MTTDRRKGSDEGAPSGAHALEALRAAVEGTVRASGEAFFPALCESLCSALDVPHALVSELSPDGTRLKLLSVSLDRAPAAPFTFEIEGSPCGVALQRGETTFFPSGLAAQFPRSTLLQRRGVDAYLGAPLFDSSGRKIGVLCVMSDRAIDLSRGPRAVLEIFAARAASEIERIRLQEQLMRSQRLEGMGRLAAGIAHDFNNLLTVILSNAEFAYADLPAGSPIRDLIAPIHDASHRATALTRQLLAFSRRQPSAPEVIDLHAEVEGVLRLLQRLLGARVKLETRLAERLPVRIDPGQLEQVLLNLAINARDALPGGGTIVVAAGSERVEGGRARALGLSPGEWVHLSVSDDGVGMEEEVRSRCFEPFFSTKGDRGTGLGLATCHGIVQQAGGQISVESAPGRGTTFHVHLPLHAGPIGERYRSHGAGRPAEERRDRTILVAEDDLTVQQVARRSLEQAGYRVLAAQSGPEALRILEAEPAIDALLTDLVMPGMGGAELSAQARVIRPSLRVLFVSGFADDVTLEGLARTGDPILMKPYTPAELQKRLGELLE